MNRYQFFTLLENEDVARNMRFAQEINDIKSRSKPLKAEGRGGVGRKARAFGLKLMRRLGLGGKGGPGGVINRMRAVRVGRAARRVAIGTGVVGAGLLARRAMTKAPPSKMQQIAAAVKNNPKKALAAGVATGVGGMMFMRRKSKKGNKR